ncbi:MAG: hypothetical protein LH660_17095 [Phormidesmis sp. CAN_BIN36]|nr:hypothetical protein [Phormidesmis sp. CAN_BIN36]
MVDILSTLQLAGIFFSGVALAALTHGVLSSLDRGVFVLPAIATLILIISFLLEDHLRPYGFLVFLVSVIGIIIWSL